MEPGHRLKVTRTALALGSYLFHGMNNGILGPSILDIAAITKSSTLQAASVLTWRSVGTLGGLLSTGFLYDRYNEHLLLGVTMLIMGATVAVAPLCTNLTVMYLFLVINGVMQGSATVGHTGLPVKIWGAEKCGPVVQAIHLMSSLGSALIPLILAPFLIDTAGVVSQQLDPLNNTDIAVGKRAMMPRAVGTIHTPAEMLIKELLDGKKYPALHEQFMDMLSDLSKEMNNKVPVTTNELTSENMVRDFSGPMAATAASIATTSSSIATTTSSSIATTTASVVANISTTTQTVAHKVLETLTNATETHNLTESVLDRHFYIPRLHYGYAFLAAGLFVVSLFHFVFAMQKGGNFAKKKQHGILTAVLPPGLVLFIFFWLGYFNGAIETVYGEVIQPFLDRHLGWSAREAAFLISIFWFSQGGGRFVGIPVAKYVSPDKMLLANTFIVIGATFAVIFFIKTSAAVWICIIIAAVGLSTERGCEVSWLVLLIPFRGINNGILFCGIYAGKGLTPIIYGVLSKHWGQMVLMYMGLVMSVTMAFVVVICMTLVKCQKPKTHFKISEDETEKMLYSSEMSDSNDGKLT